MPETASKMICRKCGSAMNHHGDKLVYEADPGTEVGEAIAEFHTCPRCGNNDSRPA